MFTFLTSAFTISAFFYFMPESPFFVSLSMALMLLFFFNIIAGLFYQSANYNNYVELYSLFTPVIYAITAGHERNAQFGWMVLFGSWMFHYLVFEIIYIKIFNFLKNKQKFKKENLV